MGVSKKWWYPQNTPKWSFSAGKPIVVGYHHFRKPPDILACFFCEKQNKHNKIPDTHTHRSFTLKNDGLEDYILSFLKLCKTKNPIEGLPPKRRFLHSCFTSATARGGMGCISGTTRNPSTYIENGKPNPPPIPMILLMVQKSG